MSSRNRFQKVIWSQVEERFLKRNRDKLPLTQLTQELAKSVSAIKRKLDEFDGKPAPIKKNKVSRIGRRKDLGISVRSGWEANCLRYLNHLEIKWEYEPEVFFFEGIKHGTVSYTPDIYLPEKDIWIEVKGQLIPKARTAIRRFKKHYPKKFKRLQMIVGRLNTKADKFAKQMKIPIFAYYNELDKEFKDVIKYWE